MRSLLAVLVLAGCGGPAPRPLTPEAYPYTLQTPSVLPGNFVVRQQIEGRYRGRSDRFEAVLEKQGDGLVIVGFAPFGAKAFALKQTGADVSFEAFIPDAVPFPPRFMLIDIQRAYWPVHPVVDGVKTSQRGGETVTETWRDGRLTERRFERPDSEFKGAIVVRYLGWSESVGLPEAIELENPWFGYALKVKTLEATPL